MEGQPQKHEEPSLHPTHRSLSGQQVLLTGGTLLTSGIIDVAAHAGPTGVVIGLLTTFVVARHSNDILDALVPGRGAAHVADITAGVVKAAVPHSEEYDDQSVPSKLKRLFGLQSRTSAQPKVERDEDVLFAPDQEEPEQQHTRQPQTLHPQVSCPQKGVRDEDVLLAPDQEESEQQDTEQRRAMSRPEQEITTVAIYVGPDQRLVLYLGPNFLPDINMIVREGIFACGVKGSGKTGVLAKIIEQIALISARLDPLKRGIPLVVFDKEGDLESLLEILPNGHSADPEHWYTAEKIITGRLQVVVNLQAWLKAEEAARGIIELVNDLIMYTSAIEQGKRLPCPAFLDEAQYWLPQDSVSYLSKETQKELVDAFNILLSTGRKRGLTPFIFTQRIAQIDKNVISLGVQIFMRQVIDNDQKRCMDYIRTDIISDKKYLAQLSEGQGIVCLPKGVQLVVHFDERQSTHISHAPTVDRILTYSAQTVQGQLTQAASTTERPCFVREAPKRQPGETERLRHPAAGLPPVLRSALEVYVPGMTYRDLGTKLGYSDGEAREIWQELRRRGLLRTAPESTERGEAPEPPSQRAPRQKSELDLALEAYDAGNTTIDALAVALGKTSWTVRPLYAQVKRLREHAS